MPSVYLYVSVQAANAREVAVQRIANDRINIVDTECFVIVVGIKGEGLKNQFEGNCEDLALLKIAHFSPKLRHPTFCVLLSATSGLFMFL